MTATTVAREAPDTPEALALIAAREAEMGALYAPEESFRLPPGRHAADDVIFFVARVEAQAIGTGALQLHDGYGELKSMFVRPEWRGHGVAALLIAALEEEARRRSYPLARLETGTRSPAAIRAYEKAGYRRCGPFGAYRAIPTSVFMERRLTDGRAAA